MVRNDRLDLPDGRYVARIQFVDDGPETRDDPRHVVAEFAPDGDGALDDVAETDGREVGGFYPVPVDVLERPVSPDMVYRVTVRDGTVELHVLPATESAGLRRFYDRLVEESDTSWSVECRVDAP